MQTNHYFGQPLEVGHSETVVVTNDLPNVDGQMPLAK
jgi:hypothetical protein